jgi:hypothetical protein
VLQRLDPARLGLGQIRFGSAPLGGERGLFAGLDLPAPVREVGAVSPSRRNSAPTSPGTWQALASPTMRRLYAAENCRRLGSADTSGSGVLPTATFIASTSNNGGCISWFIPFTFLH